MPICRNFWSISQEEAEIYVRVGEVFDSIVWRIIRLDPMIVKIEGYKARLLPFLGFQSICALAFLNNL